MRFIHVARSLCLIALLTLAAPRGVLADPQAAREAQQTEHQCDDSDDGWDNKYGGGQDRQGGSEGGQGGSQAAQADTGWPRQISTDAYTVQLYQPQIESWEREQGQLAARAAVTAQAATAGAPAYGVVWFNAHTQVDEAADLVRLGEITVTKATFPPPSDDDATDDLALMCQLLPANLRSIQPTCDRSRSPG